VFLVRHANAGSRSHWKGDDALRPLNGRGRRQAQAVADLLADRGVKKVVSSPATRCVETVEPLADAIGVPVKIDKRLAEGARLDDALDVLFAPRRGARPSLAICAHGDLIPEIMAALVARGMRAKAPGRCQKGSVWEIELHGGRPVEATYHPPVGRSD
jgi:8-oxo-dGTP diphosphatase